MKPYTRNRLAALAFVGTFAVLASNAMAADAPAAAPAADLAKGEATSTQVCAACHTADGSRGSPANPILAGQHPEYLAKQLAEFKSGARANAVMKGFATILSDADMKNVAAYYASKTAKPGFAKSKELAAQGEKIYRAGLADRQVPACSGCHNPSGAGIPSQYPRLAGQHADYTTAQLTAFRQGTRKKNASMSAIAAKLTDREMQAVAEYVAGLR
jgi:cbb3-type cytochrome c oxidase subunit III